MELSSLMTAARPATTSAGSEPGWSARVGPSGLLSISAFSALRQRRSAACQRHEVAQSILQPDSAYSCRWLADLAVRVRVPVVPRGVREASGSRPGLAASPLLYAACARVSVWRPASVPEAHHATHLSPAGTSGPAGVAARTGERGVLMALPGRTPRSPGGIASGGKTEAKHGSDEVIDGSEPGRGPKQPGPVLNSAEEGGAGARNHCYPAFRQLPLRW